MAIGGGMGDLMGIMSYMTQMTPQNIFGGMNPQLGLNPQLVGSITPGEPVFGGTPPGFGFEELRGTMMRLQELQAARDTSDKTFAERKEKDLDEAKQAFWDNNHYEWPDGPDGRPVVVEGAENAAQARARQSYERRQLEAFQDAKQNQGNVPAGPASAEMMRLQQNPEELRAIMASPNGQADYQRLAEQAQIEEEIKSISDRAEELKVTTPDQLHGLVDATRDEVIQRRADSYAALMATPEARAVEEYKMQVQGWVAGQQIPLQQEQEANWQPYQPQVMPGQVDPNQQQQQVALPPYAFQPMMDPTMTGAPGGQMPFMNPAIYSQGGGPQVNPLF